MAGFATLLGPLLAGSFLGFNELAVRAVLVFVTSLYGLHILLSQRSSNSRRKAGLAIAVTLFIMGRPLIELIHGELEATDVINFGGTVVIAWALWSLQPRVEWFRLVATFGVVLAGVALFMAVLTPQVAFMVTELGTLQGDYKTSSQLGLLAGPFRNANTLGVILATSIPFIFLWHRMLIRVMLLVPILAALFMTVSRTSFVATALVFLLAAFAFNRHTTARIQKQIALLTVGLASAVHIILPTLNWSSSFFTGRGRVWEIDFAAWVRKPWFGNGESWHTDQSVTQAGIIQADHTSSHNMALGWLTFGGIFYFVCCAALILLLIRAGRQHLEFGQATPILFTVVLLVVGVSESNWHVLVSSPSFFMHGYLVLGFIFTEQQKASQGIT